MTAEAGIRTVRRTAAGGVLTIVIDRPEVRNAVDSSIAHGLNAAMDQLDDDDDLRVGIITGAGGTFCSGMDLKAFGRGEQMVLENRGFAGMCTLPSRKPLIAAVEGWALAGGCEIALACDIIVAAGDASFGLPETRRGLVAAAGGLLRLPRRVPPGLAKLMVLTGEPVPAPDAHRYGLVDLLVEPGQALAAAATLAGTIARNAPLAIQVSKSILDTAQDSTIADAFAQQEQAAQAIAASPDAREGALAFVEKRTPAWSGAW